MQQNQPISKTAVLLFSRSLEEEYKAKSFGLTYRRFKQIYHYLLRSTRKVIRESGLPLVESFSWDQQGSSFGQRLSTSVHKALNQGYERVIVVGNDVPNLDVGLLKETNRLLDLERPVVGADERGGIYLMAFDKTCFDKADFESVDWQTEHVFAELTSIFEPLVLKEKLTDVNFKADLLGLMKEIAGAPVSELQKLLKELFFVKDVKQSIEKRLHLELVYQQNISRGPPEWLSASA